MIGLPSQVMETRHISAHINRPAQEVYDFASDPLNLPVWAPGLCSSVERVDGEWVLQSPMGRVVITFAERNDIGVLDHNVTLPSGESIYNPMRVVAAGSWTKTARSTRL